MITKKGLTFNEMLILFISKLLSFIIWEAGFPSASRPLITIYFHLKMELIIFVIVFTMPVIIEVKPVAGITVDA